MWVILRELALLVFSLHFGIISTGKIVPDKTMPITMSSTNALRNADYNFTMKVETNTVPGCYINIKFPDQQYIDGLGLDYNFIAYSPMGAQIPSSVSGTVVKVEPGYRNNYTDIVITIKGVLNPANVGGTGMFKAYYTCNGTIIDVCHNFGSIAITNPVNKLFSAKAMVEPGSSSVAGDLSNYLINIQPMNDLLENAVFRVTFPSYYNFTYLRTMVEDFPSKNPCLVVADNTTGFVLQGNITCKFSDVSDNIIEWYGNNQSIPKQSAIWLKLVNVYNPAREMNTDFLTVEVNLKNTNYTYEYNDAVDGLVIAPGPINNFRVTPVLQLPLTKLTTYDFFISFTPTNSFQSIRVVTRFRFISSCVIKNSLLPLTVDSSINCAINSNLLEINNIQKYNRKYQTNADKITIKVNARTSEESGTQIPFEIYTYQNSDFTTKVDQDLTSADTMMFITTSRRLKMTQLLLSH
jgi:hypothetical protein